MILVRTRGEKWGGINVDAGEPRLRGILVLRVNSVKGHGSNVERGRVWEVGVRKGGKWEEAGCEGVTARWWRLKRLDRRMELKVLLLSI